MNNIIYYKTKFKFKNNDYVFKNFTDSDEREVKSIILSPTQCLIGTDKGIIFFNTEEITIASEKLKDSTEWVTKLTSKK
jgi:hypothetical protein